jgi:lycopene beta-cyclase
VLQSRIETYLESHGNGIQEILRKETGVLPMPWEGPLPRSGETDVLVGGYRGGWFHPATGYAFPAAVRLAGVLAGAAPDPPAIEALDAVGQEVSRQARFAHRLNRMLFGWVRPHKRWKIFDRFYRLPADTIRRFYAMETTRLDRARILVDRPPFAPWLRIPGGHQKETSA